MSRSCAHLHHHPVLSIRSLGPIDCVAYKLEVRRTSLRHLGGHRLLLDSFFLFPTATRQLPRIDQKRAPQTDRLRWWFLVSWWHALVHDGSAGKIDRLKSVETRLTLWKWGGYQYKWSSAHVLAPLLLGIIMIIAFLLWETYGAKYPMFPKRLRQDPRILSLTLVITFISGANFFSILMFWPTQAFNVYGHDPGVYRLPH